MEFIITFAVVLLTITNIVQMATQLEIAEQLTALKGQVEKIKTEVSVKLQALADAISAQGTASSEVEAALAELKTAVQGVDDLNEDAVIETPTEPTE